MAYPALVRAIQARRAVKRAILVELQFKSGTMRVWPGPGPLRTYDPAAPDPATAAPLVWQGVGQVGGISDFDRAVVPQQSPTLTLSGVDPVIAARAVAGADEMVRRPVRIWEQYFDPETSALVDIPVFLGAFLMDAPTMTTTANTATISVPTVSLLYRRRRVALAYLSDATQQTLYPGDTGCSELARLVQATEIWPGYNG